MGEDAIKQIQSIQFRVERIEDDHREVSQIVRDFQKDFHILTDNLGEVKEVLKAISESATSMAIFRQRYESNRETDREAFKRVHDRLDAIEKKQEATDKTIARVAWLVITAVMMSVLSQVIVKGG